MKRLQKIKQAIAEEKITDALLGTGEHMCTCAALVADIIIEQGQEKESIRDLLERLDEKDDSDGSTAENIP
jgi:hypothetical protein